MVAAYREGRSGRTSSYDGPPRLVSQAEWRRCQQALAQPSKETWRALERLALGGRLTHLTPAQSQVLDATARLSREARDYGGLSLPALLALGYAEKPQAILDHLNWQGGSSSYLELFTAIDCPAAVPGLIRQLAVAERASLVRKALWRQLRVDLGPQPRAWEDWLSRPHHDPAERGQALLLAGDPCGLLWLGRTGAKEAARGLPRLLGRVGADHLSGQPWLEDSRVGFIPARGYNNRSAVVREWCWSLKDGSPVAPLPEKYLYAGGDPRGGSFQVSPIHERARVLSWGPAADGVYRLAPGHAVERPLPEYRDTGEARGDHRRYALGNGTLRMLDEPSGKELGSVALRGRELALQPGAAPRFLAVSRDDEVLLLEPQTLRQLCSLRLPGWVGDLAFDAQGKRLAVTCCGEISVYELEPTLPWSASEGELLSELWTGSRLGGGGAVALSPPEYWQRVTRWEATTGGSWSEGRQGAELAGGAWPWQSAGAAAACVALLALLLWKRRLPGRVHWT